MIAHGFLYYTNTNITTTLNIQVLQLEKLQTTQPIYEVSRWEQVPVENAWFSTHRTVKTLFGCKICLTLLMSIKFTPLSI